MSIRIVVKKNTYFDSVSLMSISTRANKLDGVEQAFVAMATEMNKGVLKNLGLLTPPNKLRIIRDITEEGLQVIHVIQRWNLTEKEAKEVEAALIDCYQGLSNIQRGYHSDDFGVTNAQMLISRFSRKTYDEPKYFKYLIIKVQQWRLDDLFVTYSVNARYEATRWCWRIRPRSIKEYPYVFSVTGGIVREVYQLDRWILTDEGGRYAFEGHVADESIRQQFVDKRIPDIYSKKGMASPVLFSKNKIE